MKKNKILIFSLVAVMIFSLALSGCSKDESLSPKDAIKKAIDQSLKLETTKQKSEIGINLDIDLDDPFAASYLQMFNDMKITTTTENDMKNMAAKSNMSLVLGGITYDMEMFMNQDQLVMKIPMMPQYLVMNFAELAEMQGADSEEFTKLFADGEYRKEMQALSSDLVKHIVDSVSDDKVKNNGEKKIETPAGEVSATEYSIALDSNEIKNVAKSLKSFIESNETLKNMIISSAVSQAALQGETITKEDAQKEFEEGLKELSDDKFDEAFAEMEKFVTFNKLNLSFTIDKDYNTVASGVEIDVAFDNQEEAVSGTVGLSVNTTAWDFNKAVDTTMPELTEENSMNYMELLNGMVMPGMY